MTVNFLIEELKKFLEGVVAPFSLPTKLQKDDVEQIFKAPAIHKMRLPNSNKPEKEVPYIIIQFTTGKDSMNSTANIRLIVVTYSENESEGAMMLLNVIDAVRIALMKQVRIGKCYVLDKESLEYAVYPDDTAPFYGGELDMTFNIPSINTEVNLYG